MAKKKRELSNVIITLISAKRDRLILIETFPLATSLDRLVPWSSHDFEQDSKLEGNGQAVSTVAP